MLGKKTIVHIIAYRLKKKRVAYWTAAKLLAFFPSKMGSYFLSVYRASDFLSLVLLYSILAL